jgi:hypothetical protein
MKMYFKIHRYSVTISVILILCVFNLCQAKNSLKFSPYKVVTGIPVGNRTGDSTGTITISNLGIQQSIVSTIPMFNGWIMPSQSVALSVNPLHSYLIFDMIKPSGDTAKIAVELAQDNNVFIFQPHAGSKILFYTRSGNATNCKFLRDWEKSITGCRCDEVQGNNLSSSSKYSMIITQ